MFFSQYFMIMNIKILFFMNIKNCNFQYFCLFSHVYDCELSLYDLYLQHGNASNDYTYLMFLAYKSISQKPKEFFRSIATKANVSGNPNPDIDSNGANKENIEGCIFANFPDSFKPSCLIDNDAYSVEENNNLKDNAYSTPFQLNNTNSSKSQPTIGRNEFDGYDIYFNMVTHISHLSNREILERIVISVFLLNCLEATSYFRDASNSILENGGQGKLTTREDRIMFAGLIFQAYCILLSNVHSLSEMDSSKTQKDLESESYLGIRRSIIGNALFPMAASILNHSCDPNTACIYINGKTQVRLFHICLNSRTNK